MVCSKTVVVECLRLSHPGITPDGWTKVVKPAPVITESLISPKTWKRQKLAGNGMPA